MLGTVVSTVVDKVVEVIWPNKDVGNLETSIQSLESKLAHFRAQTNFTTLELSAVADSQKVLTGLVMRNIKIIDHIRSTYPQLAMVSVTIISKIVLVGAMIDRLAIWMGSGHLDIITLYQLTDIQTLLDVEIPSSDAKSCKLLVHRQNLISVEFSGYRMSRDTGIYRVLAFRHHTDLVNVPKGVVLEYAGPHYVFYNTSAKCATGLRSPPKRIATGTRTTYGYEDYIEL